ncbi:MAG: sugar phosphate isomerase/epimerase [Clostridiales bacterium]|nr:sugar phosphate isomerase/epimerase [Clostridiales bacterium]
MLKMAAFADEAAGNLDGQIDALLRNGITYLEIRGVNGVNVSDMPLDMARDVHKRLSDAGIRVWSLGSPIGKVDVDDDFNAHLDKFMHTLEIGHILGAQRMRMFSFYHRNCEKSDTLLRRVLVRINMMLEKSKGSGILLCHENEKGIYGETAAECLQIHRELPALRAVFDPANFIQCGQEVLPAWDMLKDYVDYLHIKDVDAQGHLVPAGMGMGQLPKLVENYARAGGSVMTLEPHLAVFDGLAALEKDGASQKGMVFASQREAFDAAAAALRGIMEGVK